jgi:hypothetical protein
MRTPKAFAKQSKLLAYNFARSALGVRLRIAFILTTPYCRDLLLCRLGVWKYNSAPLKTKYALSIIAIVAGNAIRIQADEASPTRRAFAQLNYPSLGTTMNKGVELADKGDYDKARQLYDAAMPKTRRHGRCISIVVMSSCISENSIWLFKI